MNDICFSFNFVFNKALKLFALGLLWGGLFSGLAAAAEETSSDTGKSFATIWHIRGVVVATDKQGVVRQLKEGDTVYVGEPVRAAPDSEAVLKTADAGMVAIRPGAEFVAERFAAEGKSSDRQVLRLLTGSLRLISGWIGQISRQNHRVLTSTATIGIRGTDHEPYVLPAAMANATYRQGTYDKVNRGSTLLDANGGSVAIDPGKVGFARDPKIASPKSRALMTILLPVLLEKIPSFFVPGAFDPELDQYSENAEALSQKQLGQISDIQPESYQKTAPTPQPQSDQKTVPTPPQDKASAPVEQPLASSITGCPPLTIAEVWLNRFDRAIANRDVNTILGLFAPEIVAKATVRSEDKMVTLEFSRADMVQSTLGSIASLKDYQQRRVSLEATLAKGETEASCKRIHVKSIAIEQGLMKGKPYRFEALEQYVLVQREGVWLAVIAETTQR